MAESFFDRVHKQDTHVPDVLSCLSNLSNDEVFTPPEIVNQMLDMLPQELFASTETTFCDPACKTGVFLREIAKRLLNFQLPFYQDRMNVINEKKANNIQLSVDDEIFLEKLQKAIDHIFHKQLYGIAITELTSLLSRRSVYCSKYPNGPYSITQFDNAEGNIRYRRIKHSWDKKGRCVFCGTSAEGELGVNKRGEELETHAYEFIHTLKPEEIWNMKFDVIISNPPYQLDDGGNKNSAKPIYQYFVQQSMKLSPRFLSMIIPARWYAGGKGLDEFRNQMLSDKHITNLVDYSNAKDCFPGISLGGGVCYFLWSRDNESKCTYTNIHDGKTSTQQRDLGEFPVFVRYNEALSIVHKVLNKSDRFVSEIMGGRNPFGFESFARGEEQKKNESDCTLYYSGGIGYVPKLSVLKSKELVNKYKLMISRATAEHANEPDSSGMYSVLSRIKVLKPNEVCTDSYLIAFSSDNLKTVENFSSYAHTKFFRFLVMQSVTSISLSKEKFGFVPLLNFDKPWTDKELYDLFELSKEETDFIESLIKNKDITGGEADG